MLFALVQEDLKFLIVETSSFSNGYVLVKDTNDEKETTYDASLRAFVDGQSA
ncbi:MAG: hypothetical protein ACK521_10215 [bacterium]